MLAEAAVQRLVDRGEHLLEDRHAAVEDLLAGRRARPIRLSLETAQRFSETVVTLDRMIRVRLFAGLRERAGWSERELEAATVGDVWPALGLGDEPPGLLYAVNQEYADRDRELADGDEVALIPPVSGGAFVLSEEPLDPSAAVAEVASDEAGAVATFIGTTRCQLARPQRPLPRLRGLRRHGREGHGGARREPAGEARARAVAIHHRVGRVDIGGISVVIAVSAAHRAAALAACAEAIDTLK